MGGQNHPKLVSLWRWVYHDMKSGATGPGRWWYGGLGGPLWMYQVGGVLEPQCPQNHWNRRLRHRQYFMNAYNATWPKREGPRAQSLIHILSLPNISQPSPEIPRGWSLWIQMAPSSAELLDFALVLLAVAEAWVIPFLFIDGVSGLGVIRMAPWMSRRSMRQGVCDRVGQSRFFSLSGTSKRVWKCPKAIGYASISSLFKRSALVWAVDERPFVLSNLWVPCGLLDTAPHISDLAGQWWLADSGSHSAHVTTSTADSLDETWTLCKVPWALEPAFLGSANPSRCFMWA